MQYEFHIKIAGIPVSIACFLKYSTTSVKFASRSRKTVQDNDLPIIRSNNCITLGTNFTLSIP